MQTPDEWIHSGRKVETKIIWIRGMTDVEAREHMTEAADRLDQMCKREFLTPISEGRRSGYDLLFRLRAVCEPLPELLELSADERIQFLREFHWQLQHAN